MNPNRKQFSLNCGQFGKFILIAATITQMATGCATRSPKYGVYDASRGASEKGCVDFYTQHPPSMGGYHPTTIFLYDDKGKALKIGNVGGVYYFDRLRLVLPVGTQKFKHGATKFKDLTINVAKDMMIPVEVTTKSSLSATIAFGLVGALASEGCEATVENPQPWDPNDHDWRPIK